MDGNNSLKCINSMACGHNELPNSQQLVSKQWIAAEMVDGFRNNDTVCTSAIYI